MQIFFLCCAHNYSELLLGTILEEVVILKDAQWKQTRQETESLVNAEASKR